MRIAQIAPLWESVPPRLYGGTERVVHYLTEELVKRGHEVVLFASGDSQSSAELRSCIPQALRLAADPGDPLSPSLIQLAQVIDQADQFDVLHFHTGPLHLPCTARLAVPSLTTLHGPLTGADQPALYGHFHRAPLV